MYKLGMGLAFVAFASMFVWPVVGLFTGLEWTGILIGISGLVLAANKPEVDLRVVSPEEADSNSNHDKVVIKPFPRFEQELYK